ncbi:MAG: glycosyltransferase family 2 protein [Paludibacteraceae bacterium]
MKLSFIIPVYNVASYLRKCVDALLAQDYDDYEIILVDDGSTDGCADICDEYVKSQITNHKSQILKVLHQSNAGLSAARNSGIKVAQGEYLCFVDSDDYWQPNVLGGLMAQIERDKLDVLRFKYQYVRKVERVNEFTSESEYEVFNPYKSDPYAGNDYSETVTDGVTFLNTRMNTQCYAWAFILRRDLILGDKASFHHSINPSLPTVLFTEGIYFEDTDWTPRMLVSAQRIASSNTIVYNYLVRQGSITNAVNRAKQQKVLDDKMRLVEEMLRQSRALQEQGEDKWHKRMIADSVISIIGILSTQFYAQRKPYLFRLKGMDIWPIYTGNHQSPITNLKTWLINLSPRMAVKLLNLKNKK